MIGDNLRAGGRKKAEFWVVKCLCLSQASLDNGLVFYARYFHASPARELRSSLRLCYMNVRLLSTSRIDIESDPFTFGAYALGKDTNLTKLSIT